MRKVNFITLHCTGGPQNQTLQSIQAYWRNVMRWRNPGYHRLVAADGTVHELANYNQVTNGVEGHNASNIHLGYIGGVDDRGRIADNRTQAQRRALERLVMECHALYPNAVIQGHRDFSPDRNRNGIIEPHEWIKACPSFSVKAWLKEIGFKSCSSAKRFFTSRSNVNLRDGAGTNFRVLASIPSGERMQLIAQVPGWLYVQRANGAVGYMSEGLMQEVRP
jgi:N-acetylmuramoyl-L-alanine amidase